MASHLFCGQSTAIAQMSVPSTRRIINDIRALFFVVIWIGVNAMLNPRFIQTASATDNGILLLKYFMVT